MTPQFHTIYKGLELVNRKSGLLKYIENARWSDHYNGYVNEDNGQYYPVSEWQKYYARKTIDV